MRYFRFDKFEIDVHRRVLSVDGSEIDLRDRDFDVLLFLIENRNTTLSKNEIIEGVWRGTHVEDNSVARAIVNIRRALGDDAAHPSLIKTVRGTGYLFVGEVFDSCDDTITSQSPLPVFEPLGANTVRRYKRRTTCAALLFAVFAFAFVFLWNSESGLNSLNNAILFSDSFSTNELRPEKWSVSGESVRVSDGVARVSVDKFRKGGSLRSGDIPYDPKRPLTVKSRMRISYNQSVNELVRFVGAFGFVESKSGSTASKTTDSRFLGIKYAKAEVEFEREGKLTTEGFYLIKNNADLLDEHSHCSGGIGPRTEAIWGEWFEQTLYYEPKAKTLSVFINDEKKGEFPAGELPANE
ncbi:MAG: winged helix-turn-helix domain-containing protein, partial [Acidobacteriota bacterium]|nr:winged helix-turn-helix domain-containing protein [Acidobacteriota bacterium]